MRVNFSVTNQLATPSIHAAALANRPPAGQPGRLFVDTDNPSSGIYRDTGTVWENITGGAGAGNLQTVTDAGNTTDNNILLTYPDNTLANALVFYNDQLAQEEYLIEKRGTGITTNDSLAIQSRGNISPSTNPVGFLIDGANDIVKSFYTTSYSEVGLKLDFASQNYKFGNLDNVVYGNLEIYDFDTEDYLVSLRSKSLNYDADMSIKLIPDEQIKFRVESISNPNFYSAVDFQTGGNRLELTNNDLTTIIQAQSTAITNSLNDAGNSTSLALLTYLDFSNTTAIHKTQYNGNDIGLYLDFLNQSYDIGNPASTLFRVNDSNGRLQSKYNGDDIGISFDLQNGEYYIGDFDGISNGVFLLVDNTDQLVKTATINGDIGLKLDFTNGVYIIGESTDLTSGYVKGFFTTAGVNPQSIIGDSDSGNPGNGVSLQVLDFTQLIKTTYQFNDAGVKLDFINATYYFGDFDNIVGSGTAFVINDNTQVVSTQLSQNDRGMIIDFQNEVFKLGYDFTNDFFGIDSANDKLIASTNLLVGSSGSSSGQHLKIKVGTTDYVIELKNP